LKLALAA
ncbi:mce related family protein, partial [Vibrio parahaemolyticus VPTS-2010_2]